MKNKINIPVPGAHDHKYSRGQVVVLGGGQMTGAACLSAGAAARVGSGLVIILSPEQVVNVYRSYAPHIIVKTGEDPAAFVKKAGEKGCVCMVIGPGLGDGDYEALRGVVISVLGLRVPVVLDADGLNAFDGHQDVLFKHLHDCCVLTPHEGEFNRLFPGLLKQGRDRAVAQASAQSGSVIVLKGTKSVVAASDGRVMIHDEASPYLATAGSGDVLSGIIGGLMAQRMDAYDAACAGVSVHGAAGEMLGCGLVAPDLIEAIPGVLRMYLEF